MASKHQVSIWDVTEQAQLPNLKTDAGISNSRWCLIGLTIGVLCAGVALATVAALYIKGKFDKK